MQIHAESPTKQLLMSCGDIGQTRSVGSPPLPPEAAGAEDVLQAPPRNAIWGTELSPQHLELGWRRGLRTGGAWHL